MARARRGASGPSAEQQASMMVGVTSAELFGLAAGLVALAAGLALLRGPARLGGALLLLTGAALLSALVRPPTGSIPFTLSLLLGGLAPVSLAAAGAAWPVVPNTDRQRRTILGCVATAFVACGLVPALVFDPRLSGCYDCPANLVQVVGAGPAMGTQLLRLAAGLTLVWGPLLGGLAMWRWGQAPALTRRYTWPMVLSGAVAAGAAVLSAVLTLRERVVDQDPVGSGLWWLLGGLVLLYAGGVAVRGYLIRTTGRRMARTVLAAIPEPEQVVTSLRRAVRDDSLDVVFCREDGGIIDRDGAPVTSAGPVASVRLSRDHVPFAEVRFDPRLKGSTDLVRAAVGASSLTLEYLSAQARLRGAVRDRIALRSRIVAASDAERRRLERNLHDGAQQQLIGLGLLLASQPTTPAHTAAHRQIDLALRELREVARGVFPVSLSEGGVAAALRELGDHTACVLTVTGGYQPPTSEQADTATYQLVHDVTQAAPVGCAIAVALCGGGGSPLRVDVTVGRALPGIEARVVHATDRFTAAGGLLAITSDDATTRLEGSLPCVS